MPLQFDADRNCSGRRLPQEDVHVPDTSAKATAVMKITHPMSELLADTDLEQCPLA
jgi:hypothetical protein